MEDIIKELNIVYTDEEIIGKVKDIIEIYYRLIKYDIDTTQEDERYISVAEKFNFITDLYEEMENKELFKDTIIKVKYNPMGAFYYEEV